MYVQMEPWGHVLRSFQLLHAYVHVTLGVLPLLWLCQVTNQIMGKNCTVILLWIVSSVSKSTYNQVSVISSCLPKPRLSKQMHLWSIISHTNSLANRKFNMRLAFEYSFTFQHFSMAVQ